MINVQVHHIVIENKAKEFLNTELYILCKISTTWFANTLLYLIETIRSGLSTLFRGITMSQCAQAGKSHLSPER